MAPVALRPNPSAAPSPSSIRGARPTPRARSAQPRGAREVRGAATAPAGDLGPAGAPDVLERRRALVLDLLPKTRARLQEREAEQTVGHLGASALSSFIPLLGALNGLRISTKTYEEGKWSNRRELLTAAIPHIAAFAAGGYGLGVFATRLDRQARALGPEIQGLREEVQDLEAELKRGPTRR